MMYLEILMFAAACTAFDPVQSEEAPFMCPVCHAQGDNAYSECEANIEYKPCLEQDPVCVLVKHSNPYYQMKSIDRVCLNRQRYNSDKFTAQTKFRGMADLVMCDTSGCKAEFLTSAPFMCPVCHAQGDNAYSECEANIEYKPCLEQDPVCVLVNYSNPYYQMKSIDRVCLNRQRYNSEKFTAQTEFRGMADLVMCDTSGCKAEFLTSGTPIFCQICFAWGENADSDCEANSQNKPCYEAEPVCALAVKSANPAEYKEREVMRFCMDKTFYNQKNFLHDCKPNRECNMAMCETSGCKAEFPASA
ncbi:uncharacterized protein LOC144665548 [Oculina patagonica]